jgi:S-adenosylmethionine hydrolase
MPQIVTLLSDFGMQDSYVAEMKAVLMPLPRLRIVDITHQVPPQDIRTGAFQLLRSYRWFPRGTWHIAVVDPGVGTSRKALYVETRDYCFVGPDNGVLLWAVRDAEKRDFQPARAFEIVVPKEASTTFHGRDVFAQFVAASLKEKPQRLQKVEFLSGDPFPAPVKKKHEYEGQILTRDYFGNAITSISAEVGFDVLGEVGARGAKLKSYPNYEKIPAGTAGLIRGSHGFWELACRNESAWDLLKLHAGSPITITTLDALP